MMGIRPNRDGLIPPVQPDNPETRYSDWLTDLEDSGEIVGGVWKETDAKATSANDSVSDLATRVAALETSHTWHSEDELVYIQRAGKVVTAAGRVTVPTAGYADISLPSWAAPSQFDFQQFPASYTGTTGRGQVRRGDSLIRVFGTAGETLAFSTTWVV